MTRYRVSKRKRRPARRTKRNGGGWSDLAKGTFSTQAINPGNLVHTQYLGAGKDCAGTPDRPGIISNYSFKGLPGFGGGYRRSNRRSNHHSNRRSNRRIRGGRYGMNPGAGPLNPINGVGTTPGSFSHVPCEAARTNPLNPTMITKGGGSVPGGSFPGGSFPVVQVGSADAMRYNAPTAGYRNDFTGGLMIQTPYDARAFNQACIKTGGSRRKRSGGANVALNVALNAGTITPLKISDIGTRSDFDGSSRGLPVKFGGRRRK